MKKTTSGFTVVELLIVISIIGVLATIGIVSFSKIQSDVRDDQRKSRISIVAEALEKYYDKNGEYPACSDMTASLNTVVTETLKGTDPNVLTAPKDTINSNSIRCVDPISDTFGYIGCRDAFSLKYLKEASGSIVSIESRHRPIKATGGVITVSNGNVIHTFNPNTGGVFTVINGGAIDISISGGGGGGGADYNQSGSPGALSLISIDGGTSYIAYGGGGGADGYGDTSSDNSPGGTVAQDLTGTTGGTLNGGAGAYFYEGGESGGAGGRVYGSKNFSNGQIASITVGLGGLGGVYDPGIPGTNGSPGGNGVVTFIYPKCD